MSGNGRPVAVAQFAATTDKAANLAAVRRLVEEAVDRPASEAPHLVVLPEAAMHDFGPPDLPLGPVAEPLDGTFVETLAALAAEHTVPIVAGMFETAGGGRAYNTLVALSAAGTLAGRYRKVHLYDAFAYRESDRLTAGEEEPPVLDLLGPGDGLRLGLMTCYDLRFPEVARSLVDRGADVLVLPAAWVAGEHKLDHWTTLVRARAVENTAFVVAAAQGGATYTGHSTVVDPLGRPLGELGEEEAVLVTGLDPDAVAEARRTNPSLANRRYPVARLA